MNSTQVVVSKGDMGNYSGDLLVCLVTVDKRESLSGLELIQPILNKVKKLKEFNGKKGELFRLYPSFGNDIVKLKCKRLVLIGLGKLYDLNDQSRLSEIFRTTGGLIAQECKKNHAENVCISMQEFAGLKKENVAEWLTEGVLLGDYNFSKYKKEEDDKNSYPGLNKLVILASSKTAAVKKGVVRAVNCSLSANVARDMANEPGNGWTPSHFARHARHLSKKHGLKCRVLNKKEMIALGMGGSWQLIKAQRNRPNSSSLNINLKKKQIQYYSLAKV